MKIKNAIASAAFACAILSLSTYKVKAADVSQSVKNFTAKTNVSLNKVWTVKFSSEVDEKTIGDNIKVLDKGTNSYINVVVKLNSDKKSVEIAAPLSGYGVDKNYSVLVSGKIANLNGKNLTQDAELDFTTAAIKSTDSLKDIDTIIGTVPNIPSSINALLTDGTTKSFNIVWDKQLTSSDVSNSGTVKLQGTLEGTNYKVSQNVVVNSEEINFLKGLSADLKKAEAKISNSNEKNVVISMTEAIDNYVNNPAQALNVQKAKDQYYNVLTDSERNELKTILMSNLPFAEGYRAYMMFKN